MFQGLSGGRLKVLRKWQMLKLAQVELPRPLLWAEALAVIECHLGTSRVISCL